MKDKEKIVIFPQATGKTLRAKPRNQAERNFLRYMAAMDTPKAKEIREMKTFEEYNRQRPAYIPADSQVLSIFEEAKKECKTKLHEYEMQIGIDVENSRYRIVHSEIDGDWRDASHILGDAEENRQAMNKPIEAFQEFIDALKGSKGDSSDEGEGIQQKGS